MKLVINSIDGFRDGGTTIIKTSLGDYYIDGRFLSDEDDNDLVNPTEGMLFAGYPSTSEQLPPDEAKRIKRLLKAAIKGSNHPQWVDKINNIKIGKQKIEIKYW